jgi:peptidoglycan/xylan/chitin deacetylase (PgdA/CDA1 family)
MYHQIDPPPRRGAVMRALVVSPGAFARQMALLKIMGYRGLSMHDLEPYLRGEKRGKVVGLTFDDGYQNNLTHALPVLKRHGFTATCYAVSGAFGGSNTWDAKLGIISKPLMNIEEWRTWHTNGMEIGSHTCNHVNLRECPDEQAAREIAQSRLDLEQQLQCKVRHFCYPYGWYAPQHRQMVIDAGYTSATTTARGRVAPGDDMFALKRIKVARATTLVMFAAKILSTYEDTRA